MTDTLGTNTSGWSVPGGTYRTLVVDVLNKKLQREYLNYSVWAPFIGKMGERSPVIWLTDLTKQSGDTIQVPCLAALTGDGVAGDVEIEGSEEFLTYRAQTVYINQIRHAIKEHGAMSRQRSPFDVLSDGKKNLQEWYAQTHLDKQLFNTVYYGWPDHIAAAEATYGGLNINSGALVCPRYWYCADSANNAITYSATADTYESAIETAEGTLGNNAEDLMSPNVLESVAAILRVMNCPKASFKGFEGYIGFIHPYQTAQLRKHETFFTAMANATPRDAKGNPIFAGLQGGNVVGYWNGIMLIESNNVQDGQGAARGMGLTDELLSGASNGANVRRAIFMGSNAIAIAEAMKPNLVTKSDFDYFNKTGIAIRGIWGAVRAEYAALASYAISGVTTYTQNLMVVSTYSPAVVV